MGGPNAGLVGSNAGASPLRIEQVGDVRVVTMDDGKRNALGWDLLGELDATLSDLDGIRALAILGREGCFSAGFDLTVMQTDQALDLMLLGAKVARSVHMAPVPVVLGITGHALAMGAVLCSAADLRVCGRVEGARIGLNEVGIGMPVPTFAVEVVRSKLSVRHFERAVQLAEVVGPDGALEAGWVDELVDPSDVSRRAVEAATELAARLDPAAFAATRATVRGPVAEFMERA